MKICNITDVPTPELESKDLCNTTIVVAGNVLGPGQEIEVEAQAIHRLGLEHFLSIGMISVDKLPGFVVVARKKRSH